MEDKIELLLEKLLEGKCKCPNNRLLLEKFLICLSNQQETEIEDKFLKWLSNAIRTWTTTGVTPQATVVSFTLTLAGFLSKREDRFSQLNTGDFFKKLIDYVKHFEDPQISLAYIKLLALFLDHKSGLAWTSSNYFWDDIFQMSLSSQNKEITVESTRFMSKLLEKTITYEENFSNNIVKRILVPLTQKMLTSLSGVKTVSLDVTMTYYLRPTLRLIGNVLNYFLEGLLIGEKDHKVLFLFVRNFCLEERLSSFMRAAHLKSVIFDLGKVIFIVQFLELYVKVLAKKLTPMEISSSVEAIKEDFVLGVSKGNYDDALEFCNFGHLYWSVMDAKIPTIKAPRTRDSFSFSNQLVVIELTSIRYLTLTHFSSRDTLVEVLKEDFRDNSSFNLTKLLNEGVMRAVYYWRKNLPSRMHDLFRLSSRSLTYLKSSRRFFEKHTAVIIFQTLYYCLQDFLTIVDESPKKLAVLRNEMSFLAQVFEMMVLLIEEFEIHWLDSIEATEVISLSFDFLSIPGWSKEVVLQALKLIRTALANCMADNMALLVDRTADSSLDLLGTFLYAKARDDLWEVRKEIFEIVYTMAGLSSEGKFPSLQKVLMDSELPTLVVKMSTCDGESFVRATAIKCLQEMIQVEEIWNNALKTEDLPQKMRDILLNEAEGIVRVEAATFMCVAYEYQQFAKENLDRIYETMIYSSTTDLHWEVKVRALNFWDKVIKNHLQNQGMIDDSFPNVTFSKEHRKIVTLTDSEIRKRLLKVLGQLSSIGCLGVLMSAIKDDCDMEVSKTAVKITQRLIDLFKKYNVRSDSSTPNSPALTENGMSAAVSLSSGISVDESMDSPASSSNHPEVNEEIIDQIVNSKDVSLLKSVYTPSDYGSVSNYDIQVRKVVTPNEFLQFCQQDLNSLIAEKKNWLNGIEDLGSLLDDMLKSYEDDVNNMDCY